MSEHIEIEYKILLTKDIYEQIKKDYQSKINQQYTQTNYYLYHPLLNQKKYMLRIREKNDTFELTLKRPYQNHRLEKNIMITKEEKEKIINQQETSNEIFDLLLQEGIQPKEVENKYSLTTHRIDIYLEDGILSLDKNEYLNHIDYELEFEVNKQDNSLAHFFQIIQPYHLFYTQNCTSKAKRALIAYQQSRL